MLIDCQAMYFKLHSQPCTKQTTILPSGSHILPVLLTLSEAELVALGAGVVVQRPDRQSGLAGVCQSGRLRVPLVLVEGVLLVLALAAVLGWGGLVGFWRGCCSVTGILMI